MPTMASFSHQAEKLPKAEQGKRTERKRKADEVNEVDKTENDGKKTFKEGQKDLEESDGSFWEKWADEETQTWEEKEYYRLEAQSAATVSWIN